MSYKELHFCAKSFSYKVSVGFERTYIEAITVNKQAMEQNIAKINDMISPEKVKSGYCRLRYEPINNSRNDPIIFVMIPLQNSLAFI